MISFKLDTFNLGLLVQFRKSDCMLPGGQWLVVCFDESVRAQAALNMSLMCRCVQSSPSLSAHEAVASAQTRNHALGLLAKLCPLSPARLLESITPVFTTLAAELVFDHPHTFAMVRDISTVLIGCWYGCRECYGNLFIPSTLFLFL